MASLHGRPIGAVDDSTAYGEIQKISAADLVDALSKGVDDFWEKPSHLFILVMVYPLATLVADEEVAGELEASARRSQTRAAHASAATAG